MGFGKGKGNRELSGVPSGGQLFPISANPEAWH